MIKKFERQVFVFRVDYGNSDVLDEFANYGRLRQGWGAEGMDIRESFRCFRDAWIKKGWSDENDGIHNRWLILYKMMNIKIGDIIVVPKVDAANRPPEFNEKMFTLAECVGKYKFEPLTKYNDFGHIFPVKILLSAPYNSDSGAANFIGEKLNGRLPYGAAVNRIKNDQFIESVKILLTA